MKDYSGSAFPNKASPDEAAERGMTLRDYFAAKALSGELASQSHEDDSYQSPQEIGDLAGWCYEMADAMLLERAK